MRRQFRLWTGVALLAVGRGIFGRVRRGADRRRASRRRRAANPDQVVAEVAGKPITLKDVDAKWEEFDAAERARVVQAMYQNRRNMLEQLVGDQPDRERRQGRGPVGGRVRRAGRARSACRRSPKPTSRSSTNRTRTARRAARSSSCAARSSRSSKRAASSRRARMLVEELKAKNGGDGEGDARSAALHRADVRRAIRCAASRRRRSRIVEFSDYQCPFCARVNPTLAKVRETYGDKVKIVFKDFPLPNHPQAPKASEAAHCAGEQKQVLGDARRDVREPARAAKCRRSSRRRAPSASTARRSISAWIPASRPAAVARRHASSASRWA